MSSSSKSGSISSNSTIYTAFNVILLGLSSGIGYYAIQRAVQRAVGHSFQHLDRGIYSPKDKNGNTCNEDNTCQDEPKVEASNTNWSSIPKSIATYIHRLQQPINKTMKIKEQNQRNLNRADHSFMELISSYIVYIATAATAITVATIANQRYLVEQNASANNTTESRSVIPVHTFSLFINTLSSVITSSVHNGSLTLLFYHYMTNRSNNSKRDNKRDSTGDENIDKYDYDHHDDINYDDDDDVDDDDDDVDVDVDVDVNKQGNQNDNNNSKRNKEQLEKNHITPRIDNTTIVTTTAATTTTTTPIGFDIRNRSDSVLTQSSEISANSSTSSTPTKGGSYAAASTILTTTKSGSTNDTNTRYLEMLVHNVSHTDLVLCLGIPNNINNNTNNTKHTNNANATNNESPKSLSVNTTVNNISTPKRQNKTSEYKAKMELDAHALCKPRFSAFDMYCQRILHVLQLSSKYSTTMNINKNASTNINTKTNTNTNISTTNDSSTCSTASSVSSNISTAMSVLLSSIMSFPRYERSDSTPRFSLVTPRPSRQSMLPVGINLSQLALFLNHDISKRENHNGIDEGQHSNEKTNLDISTDDLHSLRLRGKDVSKLETYLNSQNTESSTPTSSSTNCDDQVDEITTDLHLEAVFFPLISSLLRRWSKQIVDKYPSILKKNYNSSSSSTTTNQISNNSNAKVKQVLILVTGVGTPRNWTHSMTGNSTQACAEIMEFFIKILYPHVTVVRLHSEREIFRYDGNIMFAQKVCSSFYTFWNILFCKVIVTNAFHIFLFSSLSTGASTLH